MTQPPDADLVPLLRTRVSPLSSRKMLLAMHGMAYHLAGRSSVYSNCDERQVLKTRAEC